MPAAGYGRYDDLGLAGSYGYYWSSTFYGDDFFAWRLDFYSSNTLTSHDYRYHGFSVRPVSE